MSGRAARPGGASAAVPVPTPLPTREVILDAAERLFSAHGVDGVAVRDLARELQLTPSSLYNHFPGKQALYEAVLERGLRPIVELVAGIVAGRRAPPRLRRDDGGRTRRRTSRSIRNLGRLLQRALLEETEQRAGR